MLELGLRLPDVVGRAPLDVDGISVLALLRQRLLALLANLDKQLSGTVILPLLNEEGEGAHEQGHSLLNGHL